MYFSVYFRNFQWSGDVQVAKGAADMVLTDDNFCSIVGAVEKGRIIYAGIQKFVAFIMSVHIGEVLQIFVCICGNIPVMRTPLQILFLILVAGRIFTFTRQRFTGCRGAVSAFASRRARVGESRRIQ